MKKFFPLLFVLLLVACTGNNGTGNIANKQQEEFAPVTTEDDVRDCKVVALVDSIISADPNAMNNSMTINKTEERVSKELKAYLPKNVNVISDVPLTCSEVLLDAAHFSASLPIHSYDQWRVDVDVVIILPENELAQLKEDSQYYIKDCNFKKYSFDYSMNFSKDLDHGAEAKKIMFWFEAKDAKIEPAK